MPDANTGYAYSILPYYGSLTSKDLIRPDLPVSSTTTRIVLELCNKLLDSNPGSSVYHIFTDKYFTSLSLARVLLNLIIYLTGTIQSNRKFLPDSIKNQGFLKITRLRVGQEIYYYQHGKIIKISSHYPAGMFRELNR
jgi:hypothetical protein